ncbi:hypothetical protein SAMN05216412_104126 [Nitrosospira multiformis]|uniref:Uncharacterized protein n=1 Tax=Nitrosospira multiformis TaxID=1231 RepID=A0A1I0CW39_9PROT|nr:hypothetical protein SAMN05216412_104126 [Nitrosospira multiformis]
MECRVEWLAVYAQLMNAQHERKIILRIGEFCTATHTVLFPASSVFVIRKIEMKQAVRNEEWQTDDELCMLSHRMSRFVTL